MAKDINSIQSGIVQENSVNNPSVKTYKGKNQFPQSFQHPSTCQYGYVDPVGFAKCEVGDVFPYKFVTDLNTFTMKSPFKGNVKMYSAAFKVPMEAIYHRTYDYLFSFAQKGDQVPQDRPVPEGDEIISARAIFPFRQFVNQLLSYHNEWALDITPTTEQNFNNYIKSVFLLESLFSAGSLFSKFNIHLNSIKFMYDNKSLSFDKCFDLYFFSWFERLLDNCDVYLVHSNGGTDELEGYPYMVITKDASLYTQPYIDVNDFFDSYAYYCSIDRAFELLRTGEWDIRLLSDSNYNFFDTDVPFLFNWDIKLYTSKSFLQYINIESIIAYQLACSHFFNNPKVDYIYSAELWRDNLYSIVSSLGYYPTFDYNGSQLLYDEVSHQVMSKVLYNIDSAPDTFFAYFFNLFSFQRSLRYGDYYTGSRPEPIGVGDISLEENSNGSIDSLEVARKLQLTRLLHKVAITGPEHSQQIKYIFGGRLPDVPKDVPIRLSLEEFDVEGFETNNTGDAQLSSDNPNITTTNLRLSDSKFLFEVEINEPCYLIMVQYFEAHRIYSNTVDRFALHYDLYDDFVPDMQFIGDQDIKLPELLGPAADLFSPFAYHLRNMEYKQRVSYASGGFIEFLPSWAFITDNNDGNPAFRNITPEYIRSSPSEFDRFYKSLLGHSLASRFHFITFNTNVVAPWRQMVYAPEILA